MPISLAGINQDEMVVDDIIKSDHPFGIVDFDRVDRNTTVLGDFPACFPFGFKGFNFGKEVNDILAGLQILFGDDSLRNSFKN